MGFMDRVKQAAEAAQAVPATPSSVAVGASASQIELANRAQRLMQAGVDTPAHIDAMASTGNTDAPGGTEHEITLTITPAAGEGYQATINQYVYPSFPFATGDDVSVKVDPDDAQSVMIFGKG
jgi:hypothetical protein